MIRTLIIISLVFFSLLSLNTNAAKDPCPFVTERSILGIWEAVYTSDTVRVFRLEFNEKDPSLLSKGVGHGMTFVSVLKEKSIANGKLMLRFKNQRKPVTISVRGQLYTTKGEEVIEGTGRACETEAGGHGVLDVTLTMEPESPDPQKWVLRFIKYEGRELTDELHELSRAAKKAASDYCSK